MSDQLEVPGLVLGVIGAIPPAILALRIFRKRVWLPKEKKMKIAQLKRDLSNELQRFKLDWTKLISDIASGQDLQNLLNYPELADWKQYGPELRLRLDDAYDAIYEAREACSELHEKLALDANGEINDQIVSKETFTLEIPEISNILSKIKAANEALHRCLMDYNPIRESSKRSRSEGLLMPIMRRLYREVFEAICSASRCVCAEAHSLCLELEHRRTRAVLPEDVDDHVALGVVLHVALGSHHFSAAYDSPTRSIDSRGLVRERCWDSLSISLQSAERAKTSDPQAVEVPRRARFAAIAPWIPFYSSESQLQDGMDYVEMSLLSHPGPKITDGLCTFVRNAQYPDRKNCYGLLGHSPKQFAIHPREQSDINKSRTVAKTLEEAYTDSPRVTSLPFPCRLRAAHDISTAFMYLFDTPWIPQLPDLNDFLLLIDSNRARSSEFAGGSTITQTFVEQRIDARSRDSGDRHQSTEQPATAEVHRLAFLACGSLLAQVLRGQENDKLSTVSEVDEEVIWQKCEAGLQAAYEIERDLDGTGSCASAVRWCFYQVRTASPSDGNEQWLRFHSGVVLKLEEALKNCEDVPRVIIEKTKPCAQPSELQNALVIDV